MRGSVHRERRGNRAEEFGGRLSDWCSALGGTSACNPGLNSQSIECEWEYEYPLRLSTSVNELLLGGRSDRREKNSFLSSFRQVQTGCQCHLFIRGVLFDFHQALVLLYPPPDSKPFGKRAQVPECPSAQVASRLIGTLRERLGLVQ